jgi:DNA-binding transcriptional ArsR family regulator
MLNMAVPYRKVDRNQIHREIAKMIQEDPEGEVEISSSELADKFGVQAPTMDYHLNKLVEEGLIAVSPKRGRYNRKIYRLPAGAKPDTKPRTQILDTFTPEAAEKFKKFLSEHVSKKDESVQEELQLDEPSATPITPEPEPEVEPIQIHELTLDDRIKTFLSQAKQVHDAHVLLGHEDKEILSVMNETISQTTVYLKDLSEQLSTVQNKELIQALIDERNRTQNQMERLEKELEEARKQVDQTIEKYEVDPQRVRFMHQMIISTVDDYMNRPNHSLALGRTEFRSKISKEVSDLVKYVLHLEE